MSSHDSVSPCENQAQFNQAFHNALASERQRSLGGKTAMAVYSVLYLIMFAWAVMLAMRVQPGPYRTMHLVLAMLFAPAYVLAHYVGGLRD